MHWKSTATGNARSGGNVYFVCVCSDKMEKWLHEIEPLGKVCGMGLIFLLGHSCLGLSLLLAQVTALVDCKQ